jgi:hypothetical protein
MAIGADMIEKRFVVRHAILIVDELVMQDGPITRVTELKRPSH